VANPGPAAAAWCRDPEQEWLHSARVDRILVESTIAAIGRRSTRPANGSTDPYLLNAAQMERVLEAPQHARMVLVLVLLDGLSLDEVAKLLDKTVTAVRMAVSDIEDELAELADPPLEGAAEDGHLSTLQMRAFQAELLDPLPMQQCEQHVSMCSACFARFDAWAKHGEAFVVPEAPKRRRLPIVPLLAAGAGLLSIAGATLTGAAFFMMRSAEPDPMQWRDATPVVQLRVGGEAVEGAVDPGAIVEVVVDPSGGRNVGMARRQDGQTEVLAVLTMEPVGLQSAPVDLLAPEAGTVEVFVVTADHPLSEQEVLAAIEADGPETAVADVSFSVGG
jgi:hypothetical protein